MQINILFDDKIVEDWDKGEQYVVQFGGEEVWRSNCSYYLSDEEDQLREGRSAFAQALREALTPQD